jgi:hypothetical protein
MSTRNETARSARPRRWLSRSVLAAALLLPLCMPFYMVAEEPELLLLAIRVDREQLSDAVVALVVNGEVRLPVGEVARLLELDSSTIPFDAARMTATDDDVLAGPTVFQEHLSLQVTIDRNASVATVHAATPLPFQLRRKREQDAAKLLTGSGGGSSLPLLPNPYSIFDAPFVDTRIRMNGGASAASLNYDLFANGDLAGLTATAFVSGSSSRPLERSWLTLGRRDPEPTLLGPLVRRGRGFLPRQRPGGRAEARHGRGDQQLPAGALLAL